MQNSFKIRRTAIVIILAVILSLMILWDTDLTFAGNEPDVILYVTGDDARAGPVFTDSGLTGGIQWAPGMEKSGTIRIYNNYSGRVRIDSLGLVMTVESESQPLTEGIYSQFARNMKLTIEKGRMLVFDDTVFNGSFYDMLYESGSDVYRGYDLPVTDRFNIDRNGHVDLKYTVKMDENAGNDMQGLIGKADFLINMSENIPPPDNDNDNENDDGQEILVEEPVEVFPDISGHWAHDCIVALLQHGIIQGYEDGTIRPDNHITRAETAVLVGKALDLKYTTDAMLNYSDEIPEWAKGFIASATEEGVFTGYPDGTFSPHKNISREEMAAVLIRAFNKEAKNDDGMKFTDVGQMGIWAMPYVKAGVDNEIITGYPDNTFRPKDDITRAEAFTMICRLLGYHSEHNK